MRRKDYHLRLFCSYNLVFKVDISPTPKIIRTHGKKFSAIKKGKAPPEGYGKRNVGQTPREFHRGVPAREQGQGGGWRPSHSMVRNGDATPATPHKVSTRLLWGKHVWSLPPFLCGQTCQNHIVRPDCPWSTVEYLWVSFFLFVFRGLFLFLKDGKSIFSQSCISRGVRDHLQRKSR